MSKEQPNNPLHGVTIEMVLTRLVDHYGWDGLAQRIDINCFKSDPSIKSSLKFLRKTQWARDKVEDLYLSKFEKQSHYTKFIMLIRNFTTAGPAKFTSKSWHFSVRNPTVSPRAHC